jgi:predicted ABC-type ATPase
MPELMIIAGPNGAGKSTLTRLFAADMPVIDPDAIAREIDPENPESAALAAGRQAIDRARAYIQSDCSFIVETTLAGNTYLNLVREVKALGWVASLTYIGIDDPATNIQRVRSRVKLGGHDVPVADIVRRYERSLVNLSKAAKIVDSHSERLCQRLILYDNSTDARHQLVIITDTSIVSSIFAIARSKHLSMKN